MLQISKELEDAWSLPQVIGICVHEPKKPETFYQSYSGFLMLVLLPIYDVCYCFTFYDVCQYDSNKDNGIFTNSKMGKMLPNDKLKIPDTKRLDDGGFDAL